MVLVLWGIFWNCSFTEQKRIVADLPLMFLYNQDLSCFLILPIKSKQRFSLSLEWVGSKANQCRIPLESFTLCGKLQECINTYLEFLVRKESANITIRKNVRLLQKLLALLWPKDYRYCFCFFLADFFCPEFHYGRNRSSLVLWQDVKSWHFSLSFFK